MKKEVFKKIWIIMLMFFIMFSMFLAISFPLIVGIAYFSIIFAVLGVDILYVIFCFLMMGFGTILITLAIVYKIIFYFDELFGWKKKYDALDKIKRKDKKEIKIK